MGCRPTPLPLDCRPLYIGICACACLCLALQSHKKRLLLLPDTSFPFVFLFSVCSLRPLQFLCVSWNPGNVASSQCCCVLDQELLVLEWGGHASPLRKEGAWRDHSTLIACQNIHRSGGKKENEKGPGVAERTKRLLWFG